MLSPPLSALHPSLSLLFTKTENFLLKVLFCTLTSALLNAKVKKYILRVYLKSAYFAKTENFLLKVLYIKVKVK